MANELERLTTALAERYRIERELGRGGMATVYLAEDLKHHRRVAIMRHDQPSTSSESLMHLRDIPFQTVDWAAIPRTEHPGEAGIAYWRTRRFGDIRVRIVEYSPGYLADHWCDKGHILFCLEGELRTQLQDGREVVLTPGMSYQVADGAEPHRSFTATGAKLFVVD